MNYEKVRQMSVVEGSILTINMNASTIHTVVVSTTAGGRQWEVYLSAPGGFGKDLTCLSCTL